MSVEKHALMAVIEYSNKQEQEILWLQKELHQERKMRKELERVFNELHSKLNAPVMHEPLNEEPIDGRRAAR